MVPERREKPRAEVDLSCIVRQRDDSEMTVRLIDLNCLGGGFILHHPLPLHSAVRLRFSLPQDKHWHEIEVNGRIIHNYPAVVVEGQHRTTGYVVGVDFTSLNPADEAALCRYIAEVIGEEQS